jgi:hypothetical protein
MAINFDGVDFGGDAAIVITLTISFGTGSSTFLVYF